MTGPGTHDSRPESPLPEQVKWSSIGVVTEPSVDDLSCRLRNEIREIRWSTLVWLVGERYSLELDDLNAAVDKWSVALL